MADPEKERRLYLSVRATIAKRAGVSVTDVLCKAKLADKPLYLTSLQLSGLAPPFQEAATEVKPDARISATETAKLKTVIEAYNLVGVRAGLAAQKCDAVSPLPVDGTRG